MAINPQKLLPPAKLSTGERMAASYDKKIDDLLNFQIKKKLINVDKLVNNTKKVKEKKLDARFISKMEWANDALDKAKEEASLDYLKSQIFGNQMGEA